MKTALIVAMDRKQGIGKNNDLLWHLPADMQFFKTTTSGHIVVMGRKNFESIPERFRPLPNRENVILTRNKAYSASDCVVFHSLEACLESYQSETERTVFIIGGGQIYAEALALDCIDEMYITQVDHTFDADTFFPELALNKWDSKLLVEHAKDEKNQFDFSIHHYSKIKTHSL